MAERKPISKKMRFEVFKRDSFKCQYCGRSSPDVVLEADHIVPVAEGGKTDLLNLITSCRDCNRGKGKIKLDDNDVLKKQKEQLDDLNEKREQMKMMIAWKKELLCMTEEQIDAIDEYVFTVTGEGFNDEERNLVRRIIHQFGFNDAYDGMVASLDTYYSDNETIYTRDKALKKLGGVCYMRRQKQEAKHDRCEMDKNHNRHL